MRTYVRAQHGLSKRKPETVLPYKQSELAKAVSSSFAEEKPETRITLFRRIRRTRSVP